jgi:phospholipid/cholesterol/gamma-HCH transport system substrate-binding protein
VDKKINYAMVGLFVIVLGGTWVAISLWMALGDFSTQYTTYRVYMDESVSGLYVDAPVKYRGVEIGKVRSIKLNPNVSGQVQLTLDIESSVPIKDDTIAVLTVQGLTGIAFVDLTGGGLNSPLLEATDDELYPVINTAPSFFARLDTSGTELIANMNLVGHSLAKVLDAEGAQTLSQILDNINEVTGAFARRQAELEQSVVNVSRILENGAEASAGLQGLLEQIDATARKFEDMATKIAAVSESVDRYVNKNESGVQQFSQQTLPEFGALISELRRLADTLQRLGQKLEDDPRVLLYGRDLEAPGPGE